MGGLCSRDSPIAVPTPEPKPLFNYIVRGNFIPQQNGDLKVHEEQSLIYVSVDFVTETIFRF